MILAKEIFVLVVIIGAFAGLCALVIIFLAKAGNGMTEAEQKLVSFSVKDGTRISGAMEITGVWYIPSDYHRYPGYDFTEMTVSLTDNGKKVIKVFPAVKTDEHPKGSSFPDSGMIAIEFKATIDARGIPSGPGYLRFGKGLLTTGRFVPVIFN